MRKSASVSQKFFLFASSLACPSLESSTSFQALYNFDLSGPFAGEHVFMNRNDKT